MHQEKSLSKAIRGLPEAMRIRQYWFWRRDKWWWGEGYWQPLLGGGGQEGEFLVLLIEEEKSLPWTTLSL